LARGGTITEGVEVFAAQPALAISAGAHRSHSHRADVIRRALAVADMVGLSTAFLLSTALFAGSGVGDHIHPGLETLVFLCTLPLWLAFAHVFGLYKNDAARADHSTADETLGVISLVTLGTWVVFVASWATKLAQPELDRLTSFWLFSLVAVITGRGIARTIVRRMPAYTQRALVVGAGNVGQLVARKIQQHPEYGIELLGFVDDNPRDRRTDVADLPVVGGITDLPELVAAGAVERVIVAFSGEPDTHTMALVRSLRDRDVMVDVVPRLYELVGPSAEVHLIEGMPLLTVPPARISSGSLGLKRAIDLVVSSILLLLSSPLFLFAAIRIRRESDGPVFFRQTRLGSNMRPFTVLKFRTMTMGVDESKHREYIESTMTAAATMNGNGTYKLERDSEITRFGRFLRKTSLDELPQLINVVRGEMSLVGPRPCIPYETEFFEPHHFDRFLVPQGITGLWQATARAKSTFGEALEMDVAYVRGWSLGLDLRLLLRTPFALLRQRKATA
jgi:exopolysaccharide biosynthesis polyprenyl glycosylphosphotransferase